MTEPRPSLRDSGPDSPADPVAAYLAEVREREQGATKGPWRTHDTWLESGGHAATVLSGEGNATDLRAWLPTFAGGLVAWDEGRNVWNDATFIAGARADVPRLLAAVEAVLAIHKPVHAYLNSPATCQHCLDASGDLDEWPCATYEAISRALLGEGE